MVFFKDTQVTLNVETVAPLPQQIQMQRKCLESVKQSVKVLLLLPEYPPWTNIQWQLYHTPIWLWSSQGSWFCKFIQQIVGSHVRTWKMGLNIAWGYYSGEGPFIYVHNPPLTQAVLYNTGHAIACYLLDILNPDIFVLNLNKKRWRGNISYNHDEWIRSWVEKAYWCDQLIGSE